MPDEVWYHCTMCGEEVRDEDVDLWTNEYWGSPRSTQTRTGDELYHIVKYDTDNSIMRFDYCGPVEKVEDD